MRAQIAFVVLALGLGGCASPQSKLAGTFEPYFTAPDGASTAVTGTTLVLRADGSFHQQGFPLIEGKWKVSKGGIVLLPLKKAGMDPKAAGLTKPTYDPIFLELAKDERSLLEEPDPQGNRTVWKRK